MAPNVLCYNTIISQNTRLMTLIDEVERLKTNLRNTNNPDVRAAYKVIINEKCDKMRKMLIEFFEAQTKAITNMELDATLDQHLAEGMAGLPLV
jgi:hypothetical protein